MLAAPERGGWLDAADWAAELAIDGGLDEAVGVVR